MKKRLILGLTGLILLVVILSSKLHLASSQPETNYADGIAESLSTPSSTPGVGGIIHLTPTPFQQKETQERIIKILKNLVNLDDSTYLKAGWLYCTSESQDFLTEQKTLPDGSPVPLYTKTNSWYLLDEAGKVIQAIEFQDTGDPHTSQLSLYQNELWKNITFGTKQYEVSYPLKLDEGLVESVSKIAESETLSMEFSSLNGANVVVITRNYYTPKPTGGNSNDLFPYIGNGVRQYIDQETGLITQNEYYKIKKDGEFEYISRITNFKCEKQPNSLSVYFNPPE